MGTEELPPTRAWPKLLAFVLAVACGGRYDSSGGTGGSGTPGTAGSGTDDDQPNEPVQPGTGVTGGRPGTPGAGGSVGVGGGAAGTGFVGMAGSPIGVGGAAIGTAGTNSGRPVVDAALCAQYCTSYQQVCAKTFDPACYELCLTDLSNASNTCHAVKSGSYACIASEFGSNDTCDAALAFAGKFCGSNSGRPPECTDETCAESIFGDGTGCHAITSCGSGTADLHCLETDGFPLCRCWINGTRVVDYANTFDSAKSACSDERMRLLCLEQLQGLQ